MIWFRQNWPTVAAAVIMLAIFIASALADETPPTPLAKPRLVALLVTPVFDQDEKLESLHVVATFRIVGFRPDGKRLTFQIVPVSFDLIQDGGKTVVLGKSIVDFRDIGTDLLGVANYVWEDRHHEEPQRRQRLREPGTAK